MPLFCLCMRERKSFHNIASLIVFFCMHDVAARGYSMCALGSRVGAGAAGRGSCLLRVLALRHCSWRLPEAVHRTFMRMCAARWLRSSAVAAPRCGAVLYIFCRACLGALSVAFRNAPYARWACSAALHLRHMASCYNNFALSTTNWFSRFK